MPPVKSNPKVSDFTSLVNVAHLLYHVYDDGSGPPYHFFALLVASVIIATGFTSAFTLWWNCRFVTEDIISSRYFGRVCYITFPFPLVLVSD